VQKTKNNDIIEKRRRKDTNKYNNLNVFALRTKNRGGTRNVEKEGGTHPRIADHESNIEKKLSIKINLHLFPRGAPLKSASERHPQDHTNKLSFL